MRGLRFVSIARYVPEKVVTNDDLSRIVDTNDEWIRTRTGISNRHFADKETNLSLGMEAGGAGRMHRGHLHPRPRLSLQRLPGAGRAGTAREHPLL